MNHKKNGITSKQLMVFIMGAQIGLGIIALPSELAKSVGHDGWISCLIGGLLSTFATATILILLKRYSNKSILDINVLLYGKYIGKFINIVFILYIYLGSVLGLHLFLGMIRTIVLRTTPPFILGIIISIPTIYLTWCGLKVISKFSSGVVFMILFMSTYFIVISKYFKIDFLLPIGEAEIVPILQGVFSSITAFLGYELIAFVYPYVIDKENAMKYAITGNVLSTLFFLIVTVMSTGVIGEHMLKTILFPLFYISGLLKAPVFERLDLYFIVLWFPAMASTYRAYFFVAYEGASTLFHKENKRGFYLVFCIITSLIAQFPNNLNESMENTRIFSMIGIGITCFLMVSLIFSFLNKRGVVEK